MPQLSPREQDIRLGRAVMARQMRDAGWSLRAIANELRISVGTVSSDLVKCPASVQFGTAPKRKLNTSRTPKTGDNVVQLRRKT